jgi:hypothetical protein
VVLRTVAEVVGKDLTSRLGARWNSLDGGIAELERWLYSQLDPSTAVAADKRERRDSLGSVGMVVQALNRLRELGNRVHEPALGDPEFNEIVCATDLLESYIEARVNLGSIPQ